jgi:hypothetical protein
MLIIGLALSGPALAVVRLHLLAEACNDRWRLFLDLAPKKAHSGYRSLQSRTQ